MSSNSDPLVQRPLPPASDQGAPPPVPLATLLESEKPKVPEIGGRVGGLDPTRYGDWEKNGRCIDF